MKVLVTGGTGFIGSHLVDRLIEAGHTVLVPVRKGRDDRFLSPKCVKIGDADLSDTVQVKDILKWVDIVFHLASIRGGGWPYTDEEVGRINVGITENLLNASTGRVKHFIYVSSVSVYGHFKGGPAGEDYPCLPSTRYGVSKYEAEGLVNAFHREKGIYATIIRPVITYGPRDRWGMVTRLIGLINSGRYLTVGSGENRVHLVYIDDLIQGLIMVMLNPAAIGKAYILAGERPVTINRLVGIIASLLNKNVPSLHVPVWLAGLTGLALEMLYKATYRKREPFLTRDKVDIMTRDRSFNIDRAKKELGYTPRIDYEEGLKRTVDWLRAEKLI